jgi:hypothetical protein
MAKKKQAKRYSRHELKSASHEELKNILPELMGRIYRKEPMSVSETEFACSALRATRPKDSISFINLATITQCQDFIFKDLYVTYALDLDGHYGIDKYFGLVSMEENVRT